jgi:hypothetical protein
MAAQTDWTMLRTDLKSFARPPLVLGAASPALHGVRLARLGR